MVVSVLLSYQSLENLVLIFNSDQVEYMFSCHETVFSYIWLRYFPLYYFKNQRILTAKVFVINNSRIVLSVIDYSQY